MPIQQQYYLNGTTLSNSTSVFLDEAQTVCADDGYFSDGTVVRYQSDCLLGPIQQCPSCSGRPCATSNSDLPIFAFGSPGIYNASIDVGTSIGAVIINLNNYMPNGVIAKFGNSTYNKVSVQGFGLTSAPSGLPNYFGDITPSADPSASSPYYIPNYDLNVNSFILSPIYDTVNVLTTQESDTNNPSSYGVMVIPKTTATPTIIDVSHYCVLDPASFQYSVLCPRALPQIIATSVANNSDPCDATSNSVYYVASVNGQQTGPNITVDLYDYVFLDQNGQTPLPDGWYNAPIHINQISQPSVPSFRVDDGVIVEFGIGCQGACLEVESINTYTGCTPTNVSYTTEFYLYWEPFGTPVYGPSQFPFSLSCGGFVPTGLQLYPGRYRAVVNVTFGTVSNTNCPNMAISITPSGLCVNAVSSSPAFTPSTGATFSHSYTFDFLTSCLPTPPLYPKITARIFNAPSSPSPL